MFKQLVRVARLRVALLILVVLVLIFGLTIVPVEEHFGQFSLYQTTGDGLWWAATTAIGIGYGDYTPVTVPGRIMGIILAFSGVLTFGIIVALVTVELFRNEQIFYWKRTVERFDRLEKQLEKLEKQQGYNLKENKPK